MDAKKISRNDKLGKPEQPIDSAGSIAYSSRENSSRIEPPVSSTRSHTRLNLSSVHFASSREQTRTSGEQGENRKSSRIPGSILKDRRMKPISEQHSKGTTAKQKDIGTMQFPSSAVRRDFTFTGYDIMTDVEPVETRVETPGEVLARRYADTYRTACKRLLIVPSSFIEKRLCESTIHIRSLGLGDKGTRALALALVNNEYVESIDLTDNRIGRKGCSCIAQLLDANDKLSEVVLDDNNIGVEGSKCLCEVLQTKQTVKVLSVAGNNLRIQGTKFVKLMLENNIYLQELNISRNEIGEDGGELIGTAIADNDTLEVLDLSWNHLRGRGAIAVAEGLRENRGLKIVNLSWNGFAYDGCVALGEALRRNKTLLELDLTANRIHSEAAAVIMSGLQKNMYLISLKLSKNPLTPKAAIMLLKTLRFNKSEVLREIALDDIVVTEEFVRLLEELHSSRVIRISHGVCLSHSGATKCPSTDESDIPPVDPKELLYSLIEKGDQRFFDELKKSVAGKLQDVTTERLHTLLEEHKEEIDAGTNNADNADEEKTEKSMSKKKHSKSGRTQSNVGLEEELGKDKGD